MISEKPFRVTGNAKHWAPPTTDWIMLNVDAAISHEFSTLVVVARDNNGEII